MIKLVVDSTFYLEKKFCEDNDIRIVPLVSTYEGQDYEEGFPGTFKPFFDKLAAGKGFPTTSQPSPEKFVKVFNEILDKGNEVLSLSFSSGLSGTFQASEIARKQIGNDKVTTYDTKLALAPVCYVVEETIKMIKSGMTRQQIIEKLPGYIPRADFACMPINLNYLIRGGRLKGLAAIVGKVISIKPIITLKDTVLHSNKKVLTIGTGDNYMISCIKKLLDNDNIEKFYFGYVYDKKYMNLFKEKVLISCPNLKFEDDYEIGNVVGSHLGPYAYGYMLVTKN